MERNPDDSARPDQPDEEGFGEGQAVGPDDEAVRDFAEGQEHVRDQDTGDFAEGQEHHRHADDDPEGDFAEGQKRNPDA